MNITTIYCQRSGVALAQIKPICVEGTPVVKTVSAMLLHPCYGKTLDEQLRILKRELDDAREDEWHASEKEKQRTRLYLSAVVYSLGALVDDYACLPSWKVCVSSGHRLLKTAYWYHNLGRKVKFPRFHPARVNTNDEWENISAWLDACDTVRSDWETGKKAYEQEELLSARTAAILEIKEDAVYKRTDIGKVWNWMEIQLLTKYHPGRVANWFKLFKNGDIEQELWCLDDIEDLQFAVIETCDVGNEIMHYISTRLKHIRDMIKDFYGSFTIVSTVNSVLSAHPDLTERERAKEAEFFKDVDAQVQSICALPPAPDRKDYASMALFLKAQAQHRILVKRFNIHTANKNEENKNAL